MSNKRKDCIISLPCLEDARKKNIDQNTIYRNYYFVDEFLKSFGIGKKYFIRTYGCQANVRDSEVVAGIFKEMNMLETLDISDADIIVINTCAVRENAVDKMFGEIGSCKAYRKNKCQVCAVIGCVCEQPDNVEKIMSKYPHVNMILGTHELPFFADNLSKLLQNNYKRLINVKSQGGSVYENFPSLRQNNYKAFVNIMYGCNKFCSYCIVPYTRGRERSRLMEDIIKECQDLVNNGYQEITLLGQNVNAYGKDLKNGSSFAKLLEEVAKLNVPRLRFTTSHPFDFSDDIIDVIAKYDNIMKSIHLPVQSGSDEILKLMARRYNSKQYRELVDKMRKKIKGLTLSTDIIVGFPNESEEQFEKTLEMVDYAKYESAFTFIYSPRKGTPAAKLNDNISDEIKHERFNRLVKRLEVYVSNYALSMVGNTYKVLVDGPSKNDKSMFSGYTESNKLVHFKCDDSTLIGKIVDVKILESHTYSLIGELL